MGSRSPSRVTATHEGAHKRPLCGQCRIEFGEEQARKNAKTEAVFYLGQWACRIHHLGEKIEEGQYLDRRTRRKVLRASRKVS